MEGDDPAPELIPGAEVEPAEIGERGTTECGVELPLIEQPPPPDSPARQLPGPGEGLDALDVEVEVYGGLIGAQEAHNDSMIPHELRHASRQASLFPNNARRRGAQRPLGRGEAWRALEAYRRAYRFPSVLPMKSVPSTTTGDDSNEPMLKLRVTAVTSSS